MRGFGLVFGRCPTSFALACVALCSASCGESGTAEPGSNQSGAGGSQSGTSGAGGAANTGAMGGSATAGSASGAQPGGGTSPEGGGGGTGADNGGAGSGAGGSANAGSSAGGAAGGGAGSSAAGSSAAGSSAAGTSAAGSGGSAGAPSAGCGEVASDSGRYAIDVMGTMREYIVKLPADYDPAHPYPLIFAWHGRQYSAEWVDTGGEPQTGPYFGIESASNGQAILVAPQALSSGWTNESDRDVAFADAMRARFAGELCVDQTRVFSTGFSFGAMMTIALGCARGDVFRAIAPMSGSLGSGCADSDQGVAYWSSHGDVDTTVTPASGEAARDVFVERNGCSTTMQASAREGCVGFEGCDAGKPVVWCVFSGAHVPPPFAGEAIWEFFAQF